MKLRSGLTVGQNAYKVNVYCPKNRPQPIKTRKHEENVAAIEEINELLSFLRPFVTNFEKCGRSEKCCRTNTIFHILDLFPIWLTSTKLPNFRTVVATKITYLLQRLGDTQYEYEVRLATFLTAFRLKYDTDLFL